MKVWAFIERLERSGLWRPRNESYNARNPHYIESPPEEAKLVS